MAPNTASINVKPLPHGDVTFSANAEHSMAIRHLDLVHIANLVRNASPADIKADPVNGNVVYRTGDLSIVTRHAKDQVLVLTAFRADELTPPDGP